jgi:hypothetical protein
MTDFSFEKCKNFLFNPILSFLRVPSTKLCLVNNVQDSNSLIYIPTRALFLSTLPCPGIRVSALLYTVSCASTPPMVST